VTGKDEGGPHAVDVALDHLFSLPFEDFVTERKSLTRRLRAAGDVAAAEEVEALRKPPASAWATNQLARHHHEELEELTTVSMRLRSALERGDARAARAATEDRRRRISQLVEQAAAILTDAGHGASAAHLDRISKSLYAASGDDAAMHELLQGRRTADITAPPSSEMWAWTVTEPSDAGALAEDDARESALRAAQQLAVEAEAAEREARDAELAADEAETAAAHARRRAESARRAASTARERALRGAKGPR